MCVCVDTHHNRTMSVLVERKQNTSPSSSRSHRPAPGGATPGKGRDREKVTKMRGAAAAAGGGSPARNGVGSGAEKMNMMAVRRADSGVHGLLSTVPQVVLYQYETDSNTWVSVYTCTCTYVIQC